VDQVEVEVVQAELVRTLMELTVMAIGLLLGGVAGLGTIGYALAIGPLSQALLPPLLVPTDTAGRDT
jgi:uncharacterized membrane protein YczE